MMYEQDEMQFYRDRVSNGAEIYCTCRPYISLKKRRASLKSMYK